MSSPRSITASALAIAGVLATVSLSRTARAADAPPITTNDYTLQFQQGPVTTATRMIGLGGAYAALAEYSEGVYANSASPAVRVPWSVTRFDYDFGPSVNFPGAFQKTDFENRGRVGRTNRFNDSVNLGAGLELQYGAFGATIVFDYTNFTLVAGDRAAQEGKGGSVALNRGIVSFAYAFFGGQVLVGGGFRGAFLGVASGIPNFAAFGLAPHVGTIVAPAGSPLRFGASYRDTVSVTDIRGDSTRFDGAQIAGGHVLPNRTVLPWEAQLGVLLGLGGWWENGEWIDPDVDEAPVRERYAIARIERLARLEQRVQSAPIEERVRLRERLDEEERENEASEERSMGRELKKLEERRQDRYARWKRRGVMVVADLLLTGGSPNSVGVEDFLDQKRVTFGEALTVSPRLGAETEIVPHWVKARAGTYVEPSRFSDGYPRAHYTAGLDFRLFVFNPLGLFSKAPMRLRLVGDVAPRYQNFGFALGTWH